MTESNTESNLDLQAYRDILAKRITEQPNHSLRKQELAEEKQTETYQKASIFKIEERFRRSIDKIHRQWADAGIDLDVQQARVGTGFKGATGKYKFLERPVEIYLHDSIVENEEGQRFYVSEKMAREQLLASLIGNCLVSKNRRLGKLHFPKILLENINERPIALVEYFPQEKFEPAYSKDIAKRGFTCFSEDEKAFLQIFNLWIGNWDFKTEHIFVSKDRRNLVVGLIDLEKSFDFKYPDRLEQISRKSPFLGITSVSETKIEEYLGFFRGLSLHERNEIIKLAVSSGFETQETIEIVLALFRRKDIIREELTTVEKLYQEGTFRRPKREKRGVMQRLRKLF